MSGMSEQIDELDATDDLNELLLAAGFDPSEVGQIEDIRVRAEKASTALRAAIVE